MTRVQKKKKEKKRKCHTKPGFNVKKQSLPGGRRRRRRKLT